MKTACIVRHLAYEDLGSFGAVLSEEGYAIRYVEAGIDDLAAIDPIEPDLLVVLGGPIGVYEHENYPFILGEVRLLAARLAADRPTLGICLGAQMMAKALGSRVYPGGRKEIGWKPLSLTPEGGRSVLAAIGPSRLAAVLHWHGDTFDLPDGAVLLASTDLYPNQAFAWGRNALALQFHVEVTVRGLEQWFIGDGGEIARTPGISVRSLRADTFRFGPALECHGAEFLRRWLRSLVHGA